MVQFIKRNRDDRKTYSMIANYNKTKKEKQK